MRMRSCQGPSRKSPFALLLAIGAVLFLLAPAAPMTGLSAFAQQTRSNITGSAIDSTTKEGIPGVAVTVEGTRQALRMLKENPVHRAPRPAPIDRVVTAPQEK